MAKTAVPGSWSKLRTSTLSDLVTEAGALGAYKTVSEDVSSATTGTTLQADDELFFTPDVGGIYAVRISVFYGSDTAADFKVGFGWPSGATFPWGVQGLDPTTSTVIRSVVNTAPVSGVTSFGLSGTGVGQALMADVSGLLTMASNAGNFTVYWAQTTANVALTTVYFGSTIVAHRLG